MPVEAPIKPLSEHSRYDLVFDLGLQLARVQCKWGRLAQGGDVITVPLRASRLTPGGYVRTCYSDDEIDLLAVYCGDLERAFLLPAAMVVGKSAISLRLTAPRNAQRACITLASAVEFSGAVAQLGERRRGTAEATGSSPVSSISQDNVVEIGAHEFREHFGYWMDRAADGAELTVTRRGKAIVKVSGAD